MKRKGLRYYLFLVRFINWEKHKWFDIGNAYHGEYTAVVKTFRNAM